MRILHTADWHLGKRLDYYSRLPEQEEVLKEITHIAREKAVDLVLVAGDLYDTFNPPNEAVELLYKTLKKLTQNGKVPVIGIAGNHDSPDRVNVADVLARENGIILIGRPTDTVPVFETGFKVATTAPGFIELHLPQFDFPVRLLHTAFANEVRLKTYFGDEDKRQSLQESLTERWQLLADEYVDEKGVNLLMTHLFMGQRGTELSEEPEGEKPLNIGNADLVYSDAIPQKIQYAALGHLHRYQDVGSHQPVIYSGSPLAYSFAEAGQQKQVAIVDVEPGKTAQIERINLKSGRPLKRKKFTDMTEALAWLRDNQEALVELTLETEDYLKAEDRKRLYQSHSGIIHLIPKMKNKEFASDGQAALNLNQDSASLFKDYFKSKNDGQAPNQELMELFNEIRNS